MAQLNQRLERAENSMKTRINEQGDSYLSTQKGQLHQNHITDLKKILLDFRNVTEHPQ